MLSNLLNVEDLKLALRTPRGVAKVLDGVNFHIDKSEVFGLVGETGCGKTVTSLSIIGLLPKNAITSGRIVLDGEDLLKKSDSEMQDIRGKKVSMILQDPMSSLNPVFPVGEQISDIIATRNNSTKDETKKIAIDMFKSVELPNPQTCFKLYPHELSGGMLQGCNCHGFVVKTQTTNRRRADLRSGCHYTKTDFRALHKVETRFWHFGTVDNA